MIKIICKSTLTKLVGKLERDIAYLKDQEAFYRKQMENCKDEVINEAFWESLNETIHRRNGVRFALQTVKDVFKLK